MTSKDVFMFFSNFGPVEFAKVYRHFAFVTFESRETREAVLEAGQDQLTLWNGKKLKVAAARMKEIKTRTWVRKKRPSKPSQEDSSVDQAAQAVDFPVPALYEDQDEVQHYPLTPSPSNLQVNPGPIAGAGMVPQHLLFTNNFTEEQQFYNHPTTTNQEILHPITHYNPTNQEILHPFTYYNPTNQEFFNPIIYYPISTNQEFPPHFVYYYPNASSMQNLQQFPQYSQCEVENPGSHVQNETNN